MFETGSHHTFPDASLLDKLAVAPGDKTAQGLVDHMTETDGTIGHVLVREAVEIRTVILYIAVLQAEGVQVVETRRLPQSPLRQPTVFQIVLIILQQFAVATLGNSEQLEFDGKGRLSVSEPLDDVLLHRPRSLHHLVDCTVAAFGKETLAEDLRQLHQHIALAIEMQIGVYRSFAEHAGHPVFVTLQRNRFRMIWHMCVFL